MTLKDIEFGVGFGDEIVIADKKTHDNIPVTTKILNIVALWIKTKCGDEVEKIHAINGNIYNKQSKCYSVFIGKKKYLLNIELIDKEKE